MFKSSRLSRATPLLTAALLTSGVAIGAAASASAAAPPTSNPMANCVPVGDSPQSAAAHTSTGCSNEEAALAAQSQAGSTSQAGAGKRWVVYDQSAYNQALKSDDWVQTPSGLAYKSCVYHAVQGATVANGYILSPSGAEQQIKPCTHPTLAKPLTHETSSLIKPGAAEPASGSAACDDIINQAVWAASCWTSPTAITYSSEEYSVPTNPAQTGALIFLSGGLEDSAGNIVLQDVLTWGANAETNVTNPGIWYITPWYAWGGSYVVGKNVHVYSGDTIVGILSASGCSSAGACTWSETVSDTTINQFSSYTIHSDSAFSAVLGGVMEVPWASGCIETPASGHAAFRDLFVQDINGNIASPSFGVSTPFPECSIRETAAPNGADIYWAP